ncbi:MAG TPA: alpha/beta hydrolase [Gammaproteobacteria bacterium]|nr:alpha/beta hydrolase [Gammaproteobacteria bacterium]
MPKIKINDINLYYEQQGRGQPIVFISGYSVDHLCWVDIPSVFSTAYQAVLLDNRGSGQSDRPDFPYSIDMLAEDVVALCEALHLGPCHIVGSSMGGIIAQVLAYKYPQHVRTITLCNSLMKPDIKFSLAAAATLTLIQAKADRRALVKNMLGWIYSSNFLEQPDVVEVLIETSLANPYPIDEVGYRNQLHAIAQVDTSAWIHQIKKPTLVLGSDQDLIVSEAHMREIARLIPSAQYYNFEGVGHLPFIERPEEFIKVVRTFIDKHST